MLDELPADSLEYSYRTDALFLTLDGGDHQTSEAQLPELMK